MVSIPFRSHGLYLISILHIITQQVIRLNLFLPVSLIFNINPSCLGLVWEIAVSKIKSLVQPAKYSVRLVFY